MGGSRLRQPSVDHSGLENRSSILRIHLENPVHSGSTNDDGIVEGHRPAGQARPSSSGDDGKAPFSYDADGVSHLVRIRWKDHRARPMSMGG